MVMGSFFIICGSFAVFLILLGFTIAKLYKRATRETAKKKERWRSDYHPSFARMQPHKYENTAS